MMVRHWLRLLSRLCGALALAFTASAEAQESTRARLLTELDAATFNEHFPAIALATGASGHVTLACNVAANGASVCEAAEETPADMGFGAAAMTMSRAWTFAPRRENGQDVASVLRVNIVFENEVPTRQPLQAAMFVDGTRGATVAANDNALGPEQARLLACNWGGSYCWMPSPAPQVTHDQNEGYYPVAARDAGLEGRVLIGCAIRADRRADCAVEHEDRQGLEFGANALRLVTDTAARLNLNPGVVFRVPVQFVLHNQREPPRRPNNWELRPTGQDFAAVYPVRALEQELEGRTLLFCEIAANRRINCTVAFEQPQNEGFGHAALALATRFRLTEEAFESPGYTVGERIRVPITFLVR